jgi:2-polyprenyl-3-methyl-5-hydroxy-6-metoxy-1,4-benzoquinol methylase
MDIDLLKGIVKKGGPDPHEYEVLNSFIDSLYEQGIKHDLIVSDLRGLLGDALSNETMQGFALNKPHGYPGDFEIIDKIYIEHKTSNKHLRRWDDFFHTQSAAKAVRNRKNYFSDVLSHVVSHFPEAQILNIASGPGRCMKTWLDMNNDFSGFIDCIELDSNAIEFSKALNSEHLDRISFERKNILKYKSDKKYHLIWASGIFDYFNDKVFRSLVKRLLPAVEPGGSMVIGNFAEGNPSRPYMEVFGEWVLHHRTPDQLISLCSDITTVVKDIRVESEQEGVNLFLNIDV